MHLSNCQSKVGKDTIFLLLCVLQFKDKRLLDLFILNSSLQK